MHSLVGWIGNAFLTAGIWRAGKKNRDAFLYTAIGEVIWTVYAIEIRMWEALFLGVVFGIIAIRNYILWGKNESV